MAKLFLDEFELKRLGFGPKNIATLRALTEFLNTVQAVADAQSAISNLAEDTNLSLETLDARLDTAETDIDTAQSDITALQSDKVDKDVGASWAAPTGTASRSTFATYSAPIISNPPTQAEVQNIANAVQINSQRLKAMIDDLRSNHALTP